MNRLYKTPPHHFRAGKTRLDQSRRRRLKKLAASQDLPPPVPSDPNPDPILPLDPSKVSEVLHRPAQPVLKAQADQAKATQEGHSGSQ